MVGQPALNDLNGSCNLGGTWPVLGVELTLTGLDSQFLTGKYDVDVTPMVLRVYGSTTRAICVQIRQKSSKVIYDLRKISLTGWLMLGIVSLTMYYLKLVTLLGEGEGELAPMC